MLHGHCHGNLKRKLPRRFDVGADVFDVPVRLDDLWARGQLDKFEPTDHHGEGSGEG
jgi:calcineurin-like phosphoesterase family protein